MPEPLSSERLAEIRDLNVDACFADAPYNPDVWALEKARTDLLAEVERLRTPPPPGELRGLDAMCAALHAAAETDPLVKEVAWRTFALIRAHREQASEVDRLRAEFADLQGENALTESHFNNHVAESIVEQNALTKRAEAAEAELARLKAENAHLDREWQSRGTKVIRLDEELRQARNRLWEVAKTRVWTNEDGKGFVFAEDLRHALGEGTDHA